MLLQANGRSPEAPNARIARSIKVFDSPAITKNSIGPFLLTKSVGPASSVTLKTRGSSRTA